MGPVFHLPEGKKADRINGMNRIEGILSILFILSVKPHPIAFHVLLLALSRQIRLNRPG